jgi:hypothetical protein
MLGSAQEAAPSTSASPAAAAAQQVVTRPPPRAVTEVAQPVPGSADVPEDPPSNAAASVPADSAPADPQPGEPVPPAGPAPAEPVPPPAPNAAPPPAHAGPGAPLAPEPSVQAPAPSPGVTAAPGFSTTIDTTTQPAPDLGEVADDGGGPRLSPVVWALLVALLLAGGAAVLNIRRKRLVERTRALLALSPSLDPGIARPPGRLAFAGPSASIRSRLEPGAMRWKE